MRGRDSGFVEGNGMVENPESGSWKKGGPLGMDQLRFVERVSPKGEQVRHEERRSWMWQTTRDPRASTTGVNQHMPGFRRSVRPFFQPKSSALQLTGGEIDLVFRTLVRMARFDELPVFLLVKVRGLDRGRP